MRTSIQTYIELTRDEYRELRVRALQRRETLAALLARLARDELRRARDEKIKNNAQ
jgi:hypothetical protein